MSNETIEQRLHELEDCPHDISPSRLRQIAEDLEAEGWYTQAATIWYAANELDNLQNKT